MAVTSQRRRRTAKAKPTVPVTPTSGQSANVTFIESNGVNEADALQQIFERQQSLTTFHEIAVQQLIELYRAIRECDLEVLKARAEWDATRRYIPDPLGEKIAEAFADMLFGEDPVFKSAATLAREAAMSAAIKKMQADQAAANASGEPDPNPNPLDPTAGSDFEVQDVQEVKDQGDDSGDEPDEQQQDLDPAPDDQARLDDLVEANELPAELHAAEMVCSSEGEVWWHIYVDQGQSDWPILEWNSRANVRPLFRGRKLVAAALTDEIHREKISDEWVVYRYVQIQADGYVRNLLYRGSLTALGMAVPLTEQPQTATLEDEWVHNLGMLCGRVYNKLGRDRRLGRSDFHNIVELMLSLNEATTVGHENMRLTAKKRVAIPRDAVTSDGTFDASEDVIIMDEPLDDSLGANTANGRFAVLEYSFDSEALIEHKLDQISTILNRVGIVADMASNGGGRSSSGGGGAAALSGTALRMRLIPTTLAAKGKARPWDAMLPHIMMLLQQVDALPLHSGGFGRTWTHPNDPPSIERGQPLPSDETEETNRHVSAVGGEIESRRTAIAEMHPTWDEDQVQEELNQILREVKEFGPVAPAPPVSSPFGGNLGGGTSDEQG